MTPGLPVISGETRSVLREAGIFQKSLLCSSSVATRSHLPSEVVARGEGCAVDGQISVRLVCPELRHTADLFVQRAQGPIEQNPDGYKCRSSDGDETDSSIKVAQVVGVGGDEVPPLKEPFVSGGTRPTPQGGFRMRIHQR